jgi:predicted HicB family RNase H-like nuclease
MNNPDNNKPFPVRLGDDLKPFLQKQASSDKRSLHFWIKKILTEYKETCERKSKPIKAET